MRAAAFLYPWDVVGDPDAAARIADLGVQQVTLASAYHSTRALTPRHPRHRIVTAEHAAVLYPPDAARWAGRALRPYPAGDWAARRRVRRGRRGAGRTPGSTCTPGWSSRTTPGWARSIRDTSVVNAYGDRYPWAPCIAQPEVRAYLVDAGRRGRGPPRHRRHRTGVLRLVRLRPPARPRQDRAASGSATPRST